MAQTIFITGASSGIGRASSRLFSERGWNVVATMRNPADGQDLAGPNTLVTRLDVEDRASIDSAVNEACDRFGRIDVLLNNAGFAQSGVFEGIERSQVKRQFDVNVFGVMDVTRAVLPSLRAQGSGTVINVSSGAGHFVLPTMSLYSASKFALEGWSEGLSYELGALGIGVKIVIPHGGVGETNFSGNVQAPGATPSDYDHFLAKSRATISRMTAARTLTSADIATVIYEAATDGTDQLRYFVGDDARGFVKARFEMSEADYMRTMRDYFA